jgi:hypothetical protein
MSSLSSGVCCTSDHVLATVHLLKEQLSFKTLQQVCSTHTYLRHNYVLPDFNIHCCENLKCLVQLSTNRHFHKLKTYNKTLCNKSLITRSQVCQESLEEAGMTHSPACAYLCLRVCRSLEDKMSFSPQRGMCMAFPVASSIFPVDYFTSEF